MLVPSHPQVSLLSGAAGDFAEADPRLLDKAVGDLVQRHGDAYVDVFSAFEKVDDPGRYFYAVDEHANARGHELLARIFADRLGGDARFMTVLANAGAPASGAGR